MRVGQTRRRDTVEPEIVLALRSVGALVKHISEEGFADLVVFYRLQIYLFDCKGKRGHLTSAQKDLVFAGWPIRFIHSVDEALTAIGVLPAL